MSKRLMHFGRLLFLCLVIGGCEKSGFLDQRPDNSLIVPTTLEDLQALLDNDFMMNGIGSNGLIPGLGEIGADNYTVSERTYSSVLTPLYKNSYIWAKDVYGGETITDWSFPYRCVLYANIAMSGLQNITPTPATQGGWNNIKGSGLFYRAHMFYQLAQVFAPPYDSLTADQEPGIPLRMEADINEPIQRASVRETYRQIIADLEAALPLLPLTPLYKTRPGKPAAYALLARTYLAMEDYADCLRYADSSLQLYSTLLDYNTVDTTQTFPFTKFNDEVLHSDMILSVDVLPVVPTLNIVDSSLYHSYADNDLRKVLFFKPFNGMLSFCGTYDEEIYLFGGLATDEVWLMRAECYARAGNVQGAMKDLNTLLAKRYVSGTFTPITAQDAEQALTLVLTERRKELLMRGLRWTDLRRLNRDSRFAKTLTRMANGNTYSLPPNDPRYVYPIPDEVISFNPAMEQNPR